APVAGGVQAPGERELTGPADPLEPGHLPAGRRPVDRIDLEPGQRGEVGVALGGVGVPLLPASPASLNGASFDGIGFHRHLRKDSRTSYCFFSLAWLERGAEVTGAWLGRRAGGTGGAGRRWSARGAEAGLAGRGFGPRDGQAQRRERCRAVCSEKKKNFLCNQ